MPSRDTCLRVVADIAVLGSDETGRLACAGYWHGCRLTMAGYGLRLAAVPDVTAPHPLMARLETMWTQLRVLVRQWTRNL
jgi:hypothetical protein